MPPEPWGGVPRMPPEPWGGVPRMPSRAPQVPIRSTGYARVPSRPGKGMRIGVILVGQALTWACRDQVVDGYRDLTHGVP
jgi:hypothetical protein